MSADGTVHVAYEGHVAVLTVDRPDRLNAMTNELDVQLWEAFEEIFSHDDVYCVVWRAEGHAFSAGRDMAQLGNRADGDSDYRYIAEGLGATERLLVPPKVPVVCAIQGWCVGGGFERTLLCDLRIAADDAKFRLPELAHGVIPDSGGTARLFQICGPGLVADLVLTGRVLDAEEALRHGVVSRIVARDQLDTEAMDVTRAVAQLPPLAVRTWRRNLNELGIPQVARSVHDELLGQMLVYQSEDFAELKRARAEERAPVYRIT